MGGRKTARASCRQPSTSPRAVGGEKQLPPPAGAQCAIVQIHGARCGFAAARARLEGFRRALQARRQVTAGSYATMSRSAGRRLGAPWAFCTCPRPNGRARVWFLIGMAGNTPTLGAERWREDRPPSSLPHTGTLALRVGAPCRSSLPRPEHEAVREVGGCTQQRAHGGRVVLSSRPVDEEFRTERCATSSWWRRRHREFF